MTPDASLVLEAIDLEIDYTIQDGRVRALDAATIGVGAGDITAIVGESGSGKTTLGLATGRLLGSNAHCVGGTLRVAGESVFECSAVALRRLRRDVLGFIFQDPVAALNPTLRVERQMALAAGADRMQTPAAALESVGLPDVPRVLRSFPHELSGGMAQRVGIAMALLRSPRLLVADEPTAAVDATRRAQILELLVRRCREEGCALLLLTHDLHTVARWCTRIAVMYGGRVVESGSTGDVLAAPMHPYTRALVHALPGDERPGERVEAIPGRPPVLHGPSPGCAFAPRCPDVLDRCPNVRPVYARVGGRHVCCHLFTDLESDATPQPAPGKSTSVANGGGTAASVRRLLSDRPSA